MVADFHDAGAFYAFMFGLTVTILSLANGNDGPASDFVRNRPFKLLEAQFFEFATESLRRMNKPSVGVLKPCSPIGLGILLVCSTQLAATLAASFTGDLGTSTLGLVFTGVH